MARPLHKVAGDEGSDSMLDRETWSCDTGKKVISDLGAVRNQCADVHEWAVSADVPQREAGAPRTRTNRREDIPLLIDHFIDRFNRLQEKNIAAVSDDVLALMMSHDFPGNARELENIIEHGFVLCRGGLIELEHLPPELTSGGQGVEMPRRTGATLRSLEECHIVDALRRHRGNRKAAAAELGIHPSTLFRKIKDLGIEVPEFDGRHRAD